MEFERIVQGDGTDWSKLLGRKVSVRYKLPADAGSVSFSEAIGVVMNVGEAGARQTVKVATKRGEIRTFPVEDVVAGKVWPVG